MAAPEPSTNTRTTLDLAKRDRPRKSAFRSLVQVVRAAAREVNGTMLRPTSHPGGGVAFQPKSLLALLSYCYARDIYASADVEDTVRRDGRLRLLCDNEFPGAAMIRHFRRDNREALHLCLVAVLRFMAGRTLESDGEPGGCAAQFAKESSRRITKAMFIDAMERKD